MPYKAVNNGPQNSADNSVCLRITRPQVRIPSAVPSTTIILYFCYYLYMKTNQKGFSTVEIVLVTVVIGLIGGAGWYVWKAMSATKNNNSSQTNSADQAETISNRPNEESKPTVTADSKNGNYPADGFATGGIFFRDEFSDYFEVRMKSSLIKQPVTAVWIEYGQSPVALQTKTHEVTQELGLGGDVYGSWVVTFKDGTFKPGETYFYRAAGRLKDNSVIYGGVVAFDAPK